MTRPLHFAQVREDPWTDRRVFDETPVALDSVLLVASGGCTALSLLADPRIRRIDAIDFNPSQLALCRLKAAAVAGLELAETRALLGASASAPDERLRLYARIRPALPPADRAFWDDHRTHLENGVLHSGTYEKLFTAWRRFLFDFIAPEHSWREALAAPTAAERLDHLSPLLASPYWPVSFTLFFHPDLLVAMFGPMAVLHADPTSYAPYFQESFTRALQDLASEDNYFLTQLLFGEYGTGADGVPPFLDERHYEGVRRRLDRIHWHEGTFPSFLEYRSGPPYALVQFSNIFDWLDAEEVREVARAVLDHVETGSRILIRQLNNETPLPREIVERSRRDAEFDRALWERDRSFFYNRYWTAVIR